MKANELMIGDWVQGNPCGQHCDRNNNTYYKVAILDIGNHCWGYSVCGALVELKYDDIFPIPLTPEILEKNGWVEDGYFYRHKELGYIQLGKLFEHASFDFTKYGINYRIQTSPRCMKYIHQFQHALRLCGISKEIEL